MILESTTYPETTEGLLLPIFRAKGAKVGEDFFLAFSPERIDPANPTYRVKDIPKVVGGVTPALASLVIDTRNATWGIPAPQGKVVAL